MTVTEIGCFGFQGGSCGKSGLQLVIDRNPVSVILRRNKKLMMMIAAAVVVVLLIIVISSTHSSGPEVVVEVIEIPVTTVKPGCDPDLNPRCIG